MTQHPHHHRSDDLLSSSLSHLPPSLSLSLSDELSPVGTLSKKMHTLLQQMWWRLKGNSFARVMNFMPRFVWFFFCSFVFNPCQQLTQLVTACRKKKKKKKTQMNNSKPSSNTCCVPCALNLRTLFYISLSSRNLSLQTIRSLTCSTAHAGFSHPASQRHNSLQRLFFAVKRQRTNRD